MMSSSSNLLANLNSALREVDGTAPGIQRAASAMMKLYDTNAATGVTSWRNILQSCRTDQLLPLVYVANEVLQTSKRNRGNKFLEAFGGHLGQSAVYIASRFHDSNPPTAVDNVEKIRRVIKIWGDRQVFSVRYVNDLLIGLDPYRRSRSSSASRKTNPPVTKKAVAPPKPTTFEDEDGARFSPIAAPTNFPDTTEPSPAASKNSNTAKANNDDDDDDDIMNILEERDKKRRFGSASRNDTDLKQSGKGSQDDDNNDDRDDEDDDDDDENDIFGDDDDASQRSDSLKIEIDVNEVSRRGSLASQNSFTKRNAKRQKSSTATTSSESDPSSLSGAVVKLSTSHFVDLFHRLIQLKQQSDLAQVSLKRIRAKLGAAANPNSNDDTTSANTIVSNDQLENLVGDELLQAKKQNDADIATVIEQRTILYKTAMEQYTIEQMIIQQYLPWFDVLLQQDTSDIQFCKGLEELLQKFRPIHYQIQIAHQQRMEEISIKKHKQEEMERLRKEREENDRFRKAALAKETEAKPGMVWNPTTREYQALNTDESWRD